MQVSQIPQKISVPFASAGGKNTIPVPSQISVTPGAASFSDGFPPLTRTAVLAGGVPPFGLDMNGILYDITVVQQWQSAGGQFKYDLAFSTSIGGYPKGATLLSSNNDAYWVSTADDNTTDPDSALANNWASLSSYGIAIVGGLTNVNVALTPEQFNKRTIVLAGALTGDLNILFPVNQQPVRVVNNTTGPWTVSCKTSGGIAYAVVQGGQEGFYGDGANLVPALGNTPPKFDDSTRPATSEFVKQAGVHHADPVTYSASTALLAATAVGALVIANGNVAPITFTLPQSAACDPGSTMTIANTSQYPVTVVPYAGEFINSGNTGVTSVVIAAGESVCMSLTGTIWVFFAGSAQLKYMASFAALLSGNGYQKLPSGMIKQWGSIATPGSALGVVITFPIAFPNACLAMTGVDAQSDANSVGLSINSTTQATARTKRVDTGAYVSAIIYWEATGY